MRSNYLSFSMYVLGVLVLSLTLPWFFESATPASQVTISVNPTTIANGGTITVIGFGFTPSGPISGPVGDYGAVGIRNTQGSTGLADASGNYQSPFRAILLSSSSGPSTATFSLTDYATGLISNTVTITVTPVVVVAPTILVIPQNVQQGGTITIAGGGFTRSGRVQISVYQQVGTVPYLLSHTLADQTGAINTNVPLKSSSLVLPVGQWQVVALDQDYPSYLGTGTYLYSNTVIITITSPPQPATTTTTSSTSPIPTPPTVPLWLVMVIAGLIIAAAVILAVTVALPRRGPFRASLHRLNIRQHLS